MAENQLSGMLIRGASRTIFEQVTFSKQRVTGLDWVSYPLLRFKESPTVTTVQMGHQDEVADLTLSQTGLPGPRYRGVGESLEAVVPAAIGNAVFDATGVRMRQVPLTPVKVRDALRQAGRLYRADRKATPRNTRGRARPGPPSSYRRRGGRRGRPSPARSRRRA